MNFKRNYIQSFYANEFHSEENPKTLDIFSPHDGSVLAKLEITSTSTLDKIVAQAKIAQEKWASLTFKKRSEVIYKYRELVIRYKQELAHLIHIDNGKTLKEAVAEVEKVVELTEFACSIPQLVSGETQMVSRGIIAREERRPVGVFGIIAPFNFPLMVPNWSIPNAIALGNAVILKGSELCGLSASFMADLWKQAGLPSGIFNLVNGQAEIANAMINHPEIDGITFVGSTEIAKLVHKNASNLNKRVLALGGAKNHIFVLKDAPIETASSEVLAAALGMAGQRCMAASVALVVGQNEEFIQALIEKARKFKLDFDLPPLVSKASVDKLVTYLNWAKEQGAKILVNGITDFLIPENKKEGFWFGPTIIDWSEIPEKMGSQEVFGPILEIIRTKNLSEAIKIQQKSPYGNAASVYTQSGRAAEEIIAKVKPGMLGVNIGVPVPREPFSFGGTRSSKFGYGDITGKSSINFWTNLIKVTTKWNPEDKQDWMS
ncbi:aldehyde dehydrogenase family protein [Mesomycoplasma hyopneumoniae]|uniref:aldehyde dehydrogenase family protein n=1 Tax=Mesomycoplasma hyopneumoniae TaxID=2099 RepID=UPI0010846424|nr:aldehyde dehydrogenase family protein [Mesomycoplasma hyopneumoniae]MXR33406.1 aldehyde dehydrogenase family protein [Mesomycoplasma hyopneumoniae]QBY87541.1 aldehyde dehydrogenase family protein [Mesomycoplasma hyopneumoniae]QLG43348.1 aldehyde dehydrogenase family protein [Mesomycoplasma hyopneumoniae]